VCYKHSNQRNKEVIFLVLTLIFILKQIGLQYLVVFLLFRISNTLLPSGLSSSKNEFSELLNIMQKKASLTVSLLFLNMVVLAKMSSCLPCAWYTV